MGYEIYISKIRINGNIKDKGETLDETSINYTMNLEDICLAHLLHSCNCPKIHIWSFRNDCHKKRGDVVAQRALCALLILSSIEITPGNPKDYSYDWGWGTDEYGKKLPNREFVKVVAYHIKRIMKYGIKYPTCYFFGDHDDNDEIIGTHNYEQLIEIPDNIDNTINYNWNIDDDFKNRHKKRLSDSSEDLDEFKVLNSNHNKKKLKKPILSSSEEFDNHVNQKHVKCRGKSERLGQRYKRISPSRSDLSGDF